MQWLLVAISLLIIAVFREKPSNASLLLRDELLAKILRDFVEWKIDESCQQEREPSIAKIYKNSLGSFVFICFYFSHQLILVISANVT